MAVLSQQQSSSSARTAVVAALVAISALLAAAPGRAAEPWIDVGFTDTTARPDVDLVIVRERAFESVDLSVLDLGTQDFVQSIYFRLYAGEASGITSFTATVTFPEGVEILGFVTSSQALGGAEDDATATGTDALFGIDVDPDAYSAHARGFESGGQNGAAEFILSDTRNSFAFALNVMEGVDDFRVLIDYGDSFPDDAAFDVGLYPIGAVGGAEPSPGIQVGHPLGNVLGNGDFGEVGALFGVPLTSYAPPRLAP